jgi:hypothetical protein
LALFLIQNSRKQLLLATPDRLNDGSEVETTGQGGRQALAPSPLPSRTARRDIAHLRQRTCSRAQLIAEPADGPLSTKFQPCHPFSCSAGVGDWFGALGVSSPLTTRTTQVAFQLRSTELAELSILESDRRAFLAKVCRRWRTHKSATIPTETVRNTPFVRFRHLSVPSRVFLVGSPRRNLSDDCVILNRE